MINDLKGAHDETTNGGAISWDLGNSFDLRLLIHYVGDIHQPLHAVSRYAKDFPTGDRGGNSFKITSKDGISNLHALWDSAVYLYKDDLALVIHIYLSNILYSLYPLPIGVT